MLVYLDNCCFNRPFDDQTQMRVQLETEAKLGIQREIRSGKLRLAWSYMLDYENYSNPIEARRESIQRWRNLATTDTNQSSMILDRAREFHRAGFKKKDAIHLAAALAMKCELFFTTDDGILRRRALVVGIRVLNPIEYYADFHD
ncbi:MAG: hypothetical protein JNJ70_14470 [Verrucomicrobiales bacterium]|nr:hypothetical protein [Verrucomicrobiales bacterium]